MMEICKNSIVVLALLSWDITVDDETDSAIVAVQKRYMCFVICTRHDIFLVGEVYSYNTLSNMYTMDDISVVDRVSSLISSLVESTIDCGQT